MHLLCKQSKGYPVKVIWHALPYHSQIVWHTVDQTWDTGKRPVVSPLFYSTGSHLWVDEGSPLYASLTMVRGQQAMIEMAHRLHFHLHPLCVISTQIWSRPPEQNKSTSQDYSRLPLSQTVTHSPRFGLLFFSHLLLPISNSVISNPSNKVQLPVT